MTLTVLPAFSVTLYKKYCPSTTNPDDIVYQPTEIYFPIPPTATDVPTAPTIDTEPELIPGNSAVVDECFDPDNVDLSQIFNNLLPSAEVDPVYDASITTDVLLQPRNQIYPIRAVLRSIFGIYGAGYGTRPKLTEVPALAVRTVGPYYRLKAKLELMAATVALVGRNIGLQKAAKMACFPGKFVWSGISADINFQGTRVLTADGGSFVANYTPEVLVLSHFDSYDTYGFAEETGNTVGYNWWYNSKPVINTTTKKIGAGSLDFESASQGYLYTYLDPVRFTQFIPEFTIETWAYATSLNSWVRAFGVGPEASDINTGYTIDLYSSSSPEAADGYVEVVEQTGAGFPVTIFYYYDLDLPADQWHHIALEQSADGIRIYINGVNIPNQGLSGNPLLWPLPGSTQGIDLRGSIQLGTYSPTPWNNSPGSTYGQIDELRIVAGGIYAGQSFTPPTIAYTTDSPLAQITNLVKLLIIDGLSATFVLTGQAAALDVQAFSGLSVTPGAFTLSGQDAGFARPSIVMLAEAGAFTATFVPSVDQPSVVNSSSGSSNYVSQTISWPAGYIANDLAIIFTETSSFDSNDRPIPPPYGWAQVPNSIANDTLSYSSAFYKFAKTGAESAVQIGLNGDHIAYVMVVFRGVDTANPFVEVSSDVDTADNNSVTFPSLSEFIPRTRIIESFTAGADSSTVLALSGRADSSDAWVDAGLINRVSTAQGDGGSMVVYNATTTKQTLGLPGSTATLNVTRTNTLMTIALRPKGWTAPP